MQCVFCGGKMEKRTVTFSRKTFTGLYFHLEDEIFEFSMPSKTKELKREKAAGGNDAGFVEYP